MKNILVPVDFSEQSESALQVAVQLAKKHSAKVHLIHMVGLEDSLLSREQADTALEAVYFMKLTAQKFEEFLDKDYLEGVDYDHNVHRYKSFKHINEIAHENNIDLVVMGSQGTNALTGAFMGSNTEKVVRTSEIPVLVVKENQGNFKLDTVVMASNFDPDSIPSYKKIKNFIKDLGGDLRMLYVNLPGAKFRSTAEIEQSIHTFYEEAGASNALELLDETSVYNHYTVEDGLFEFSRTIGADMIAIPTHGRTGFAHMFYGSISEDVANHATVPVLTVKMS